MSIPGFDPSIVEAASKAQCQAADPTRTVFVEANAGSGKTRVLVDRVARLLLAGAKPDRILCVTFTKAAAGEMQARLFRKLGQWSTLQDETLAEKLYELTGDNKPKDFAAARRLFARALETPGGLKIQTLHAFCESLLHRFPLEAGLPPGFEVLDDSEALRQKTLAGLYGEAATKPEGMVSDCINILLHYIGPTAIEKLAGFASQNRHHLLHLFDEAGSVEAMMDRASLALGVLPDNDELSALQSAWDETSSDDLEAALSALQSGETATSQNSAASLAEILELAREDQREAMESYIEWITTKTGEVKKPRSLFPKKLGETYRILVTLFGEEGSERHRITDEVLPFIAAAKTNKISRTSLFLAHRFLSDYRAELSRLRKVEFPDLVACAKDLLTDSQAKTWVLYKLDAGLDHVLVDEAQDTAPEQWAVINALTEEFFAGKGIERDDTIARSVFCVGDEKQSIYSFQNARPEEFLKQKHRLETGAHHANLDFASPALQTSFRSAPEILSAVDACFASEAAVLAAPEHKDAAYVLETKLLMSDPETDETRDSLAFHHYQTHMAARMNMPGCVEIWPAVPQPTLPQEDTIELRPVDEGRADSSRNQLAEAVAAEIAAIINRGDAVWTDDPPWEARPAEAGDIVVLVRKRSGLFEEIIRRLKLKNIPVAGADRMCLPEQLVVEDLLSLAQFALLPEDDLSLGEVLKSPFFHPVDAVQPLIDDEALFDLSQRPGKRLWDKLRHFDDERFNEARETLQTLRSRVEIDAPYGFFNHFLNTRSVTGETRLARLYARMGEEARDPTEEFLTRALNHEIDGAPSLARFVCEMVGDTSDIKREMEGNRNEVRVMTVHGAKGLEAPIVILPDTTQAPKDRAGGLHTHEQAGLIWGPDSKIPSRLIQSLKEKSQLETDGEYDRLFYVAMTRARDRLIVCGHMHGQSGRIDEGSWYDRASRAFLGSNWADIETPMDKVSRKNGWKAEPGLRFGPAPNALKRGRPVKDVTMTMPDWLTHDAPEEGTRLRTLAPSKLLNESEEEFEPVSLSPLAKGGQARFRRGNLIHKLLQTLPDLPVERRESAARQYLSAQKDLDDSAADMIVKETLNILHDAVFAPLFGPGSRAEVAIAGQADGLPSSLSLYGQIDRLVVTDNDVMIVDYKTNRPPPETVDGVPKVYLAQMAGYRALLRQLYREKTVRCALLWTDRPHLMALADDLLDAALKTSDAVRVA